MSRPSRGAAVVALCWCALAGAEQVPILIDASFDDWAAAEPGVVDAVGDQGGGSFDLLSLQVADDAGHLFLRFTTADVLDLSENNQLVVVLDSDADVTTGQFVDGLGAELVWTFGDRQGTFHVNGTSAGIEQFEIGLRSAPTVSGVEHEVAIARDAVPDGIHPLFTGDVVHLRLRDGAGDAVPDIGAVFEYTLDAGTLPPEVTLPLTRDDPQDLRVASYNVLFDSPWNPQLGPAFGRQLAAVEPDIIFFQEIAAHTIAETITLVDGWLPLEDGGQWYGARRSDTHTVSRYPILDTWDLDGNLAALIDTPAALGPPLLAINVHFPCCANDAGRQNEVDRLLAFLRDANTPGGAIDIVPGTPIVIAGDTNFVGDRQQLTSLLTGDIVDEATFGPDAAPDTDGSALINLISRHTARRETYTWRNDDSSFWPGHLDYIVYADSAWCPANHFVVHTPTMAPADLAAAGVLPEDSTVSDHLLVCADFRRALFGDVVIDGLVDLNDIICVLDGFAGVGDCAGPEGDVWPCGGGDGVVDLDDVIAVVNAVGGHGACTAACP